MDIRGLLSFRQNETRFQELVNALAIGELMLFVGAGLSIPFGMKGWSAFLHDLARRAGIERKVASLLSRDKYKQAAERTYRALGRNTFEEALKDAFGVSAITLDQIQGSAAIMLLPELVKLGADKLVVTTNFDRVVEVVFDMNETAFAKVVVGGRPEALRNAIASGQLCLFKLHGEVHDPIGRVLRKSEYLDTYGRNDEHSVDTRRALPNALATTFQRKSLLFVGCSLRKDRTMAVLKEISGARRASPSHFAILEESEPTDAMNAARDRQLLNHYKIKTIWYPKGEHDAVFAFLGQLHKDVAHRRARMRPSWADFAFDLTCDGDLLGRDRLCEGDFTTGAAVRPPKLDDVLKALTDRGRILPGRHVAISGAPGTGKSALAAWVDFTLSEQGRLSAYLSGRHYQSQINSLADRVRLLHRGAIAIIDDVHLVRSDVGRLKDENAVSLVLFGRAGIFDEMKRASAMPPATIVALAEEDGKVIASSIAREHGYSNSRLNNLLEKTGSDLVFTKWMLYGELQHGKAPSDSLVERAEHELNDITGALAAIPGEHANEFLRLFLTLACFRALEVPCKVPALTGVFGFELHVIQELSRTRRDASYDRANDELILGRHPKLAALFAKAADRMPFKQATAIAPTCAHLGVRLDAVNGFDFQSIILGAIIGKRMVEVTDLVDRLIYGGMHVNYEELALTASEIEMSTQGADGTQAVERRLELTFAMANGMRRVEGGNAAVRLLGTLRIRLQVSDLPDDPFPSKGFILYQQAYLDWLNNNTARAGALFEESAQADDVMAELERSNTALSSWHRAKAAMSRIAGARMVVETAAMQSIGGPRPTTYPDELAMSAEVFRGAIEVLDETGLNVDASRRKNVKRFKLNALLHLAQTYAWLGCESEVKQAVDSAKHVGLEIDRDTHLAIDAALGQLAFAQGRYHETVSRLKNTPEIMLTEKAGETSGLRAQLLANAYLALGEHEEFKACCEWMRDKCPEDAGNKPAIDWARRALAIGP